MSITTNCMILGLSVGMWSGHRLDRAASAKVTADANASGDAARVNKHLVPKEALKDIVSASSAVRNHFYSKTLPWKDNGDRLITRLMFPQFAEEHGALVRAFDDAVSEFITLGYPQARAKAEFRMGDMFDPNDYPSPDSLRRRFYVSLDIDAVTESGDFRVQLDQDQQEAVRKSMESAMTERLLRAQRDVWQRISDTVGHFAAKMGDGNAVFRDATVRNLEELIDLLPGLNVVDDPDLKAISTEVKARLSGYEPKDLRQKPEVRSQAAKEAQDIMERMAPFMKGLGMGADA